VNPPQQIPACFFPLSTEDASREYEFLARKLFDAGRLTLAMHRALSSYALQVDSIIKAKEAGRHVSAFSFATMDKSRSRLKLEELENPFSPAKVAPPQNKFAHCGFSSRSRAA
jgi:hypothetical protein